MVGSIPQESPPNEEGRAFTEPPSGEVTQLLDAWARGDASALAHVFPLVLNDLRQLAAFHLQRQRRGHTLQPTALVNEAYLRLTGGRELSWQCRAQFFAYMGTTMRRLLINHARRNQAMRHGGDCTIIPIDEAWSAGGHRHRTVDLLDLDRALHELTQLAPRQSRIVELRYFAGLTVEETAHTLEISPRTVKREWRSARLWLLHTLEKGKPERNKQVTS